MPTPSGARRATAAVALTGVAVLLPGSVASAQIPGVGPSAGQVVVADSTVVQVAVEAPDVAAGTVAVTVQNNGTTALTCSGFSGGRAGTVTEAEIVARSVSYYAKHPTIVEPQMDITVTGSSGLPNFGMALGSVTTMLPGSVTGLLRPEFGEQAVIGRKYTDARLAGRVGGFATVSIPARSATPLSVRLGDPSVGPRTDFTAGALVACTINGQPHVFAGYQGDEVPSLPLGSLGPADTGRFGS